MADNNQDFIQVLLEKIEKDDLPTNVFDVEGTDPLVLLGKMNEIIGQLENFQSSVNTSNSTANEALSKAEDAVDASGQALSNANTALGTANQAIGTANTAIETANQTLETAQDAVDTAGQALSNSNTALNTANTAIDTANTALGTANTALSTSQSANATSSQALDTANNANETANSALESAGTANTTAETAKNIAETANQNSNQAVTTANEAKGIAETANQNSNQAVTTANEAKSTAENALEQVTQGLGTKVYVNNNLQNRLDFTEDPQAQINQKANQSALTSEINNRTSADSNLQSQINTKASLDDLNTFTQQVRSQDGFLALSSDFAINKNNQTQGRFFIDDSDDLGITVDSMAVSNSKNGIFIKKNSRVTNGVSITLKSLGTLKFTNDNSALKLSLDNIQADVATEINNLKGRSYIQEQTDTYVKWSDGRMEQHFTVTTSAGKVTSHTFPVAFTSTPIVHRNIMKDGKGNADQLRGWNVSALTSTGFQLYTPDISGANTSMISAYGKWK